MISLQDVKDAQARIAPYVVRTPLLRIPALDAPLGCQVYLKFEGFQVMGAFKIRGAMNKALALTPQQRSHGLVCASSGNHAQGVACAAQRLGVRSVIVMPTNANPVKLAGVKSFGGEVELVGTLSSQREARAEELSREEGMVNIHPYADPYVAAGQGTIGLEIVADLPDAAAVAVPIGGGGLISGVAFAIKQLNPNIKVYGVQASGAPSMYESIHNDKITCLDSVSTIADGIAVKEPGPHTFEYVKKYVDDIVTVTDDEISAAILALIEKQKLIAEGAGAASVAAAMFHKVPVEGKKVVCLVSGGNIDVTILSRVIKRGLLMSGRSCMLNIELLDKPGQLKDVSRIIADLGGNVISIHHERANEGSDINGCFLRITMETRDYAHIQEIRSALMGAGFHLVD